MSDLEENIFKLVAQEMFFDAKAAARYKDSIMHWITFYLCNKDRGTETDAARWVVNEMKRQMGMIN